MKSIYSISRVKKILKYTLKIAIEGILVGIVAGLIVSYLFDVPSISLNKTTVKIYKDNLDVNFSYENK